MAGRPRKPTPLHLIEGHGMKAAQRSAAGEPPPAPVVLACPAHLDDGERKAWEYLADLAGGMKITSREDVAAMEMLACAWAQRDELQAYFRKLRADGGDGDGDVYVYETITKDGSAMRRPRPEKAILDTCEKQIILLLGRFGLTPSDRSKVRAAGGSGGTDGPNPDDEFK
jgi:phage terminase small subunit